MPFAAARRSCIASSTSLSLRVKRIRSVDWSRRTTMSTMFAQQASTGQVSYRGLRGWLEEVQKMGELLHVNGAHWDAEMGAITQMLTEKSSGTAPAILFDEVPGYAKGFRTLYGHFSSIRRVALTLGLPLRN